MRYLLVALGGAAFVIVAYLGARYALAYAPDPKLLAVLRSRQSDCVDAIGARRKDDLLWSVTKIDAVTVVVSVNELFWRAQTDDDRRLEAIEVYCAMMPESGLLTVSMRGAGGTELMRLRNGHVLPPP